ncbi:hypothetical protein SCD_n02629 [Sulfuricella denitrificans skB26]|uniref:DUF4340 domain-containing protein n=1 Tax=Sulfuricella denitrificans (strain DSM 22764 / NBRC 105220 / skB26) TaxID=1163617 RepID=S6ANI3_SULDS|nr:DUF4340 domain-containing protein [Sulfuricella denitrificans]BAN36429.1 hypothetical protein SCD_n02629 [Sulfuricella denitrificans skB26]
MKYRILLNLVLAALVAALILLVWLKPKPTVQTEFKLSTLASASVKRITIEKPGQPAIVLQNNPAGWRLIAPFQARAERTTVGRLLEILAATSLQRFPATDLGRFQLDNPLLRLTINDQKFSFGTQNTLTGEVYVATNGGVHLVAPSYLVYTMKMPADFAARAFLAEEEKLAGFEFVDLNLSQNSDGKWSVSPARPNWSQDDINRWVDEWRHASSLVTQPYDGTPAQESFTLRLGDGKLIPCKILRHEPELVILREDEKLQYHFPAEIGKRLLRPGK